VLSSFAFLKIYWAMVGNLSTAEF